MEVLLPGGCLGIGTKVGSVEGSKTGSRKTESRKVWKSGSPEDRKSESLEDGKSGRCTSQLNK